MADITPAEARESLADIDFTARQMRQTLAASQFSSHLMTWGLVWIAGFGSSYLLSHGIGLVWMVLVSLGIACSLGLGIAEQRRPVVQRAQGRKLGLQILLFWTAIIAYAEALGWLLPLPTMGARQVVIVTIVMLGYVVLGIWLRSSILSLIGLGVTLATFAGWHWLLPRDFMLWMAVFGGGGLFLPGLYVQLRWK
jgi:hypothetical protein